MIFQILAEEQPRESPHDESITFFLVDIKKSVSQCSVVIHCAGLSDKLGLPPRMITPISASTGKLCILSGRAWRTLQRRGLREGCPSNTLQSSCVVFDLFHNLAMLNYSKICRSMRFESPAVLPDHCRAKVLSSEKL